MIRDKKKFSLGVLLLLPFVALFCFVVYVIFKDTLLIWLLALGVSLLIVVILKLAFKGIDYIFEAKGWR